MSRTQTLSARLAGLFRPDSSQCTGHVSKMPTPGTAARAYPRSRVPRSVVVLLVLSLLVSNPTLVLAQDALGVESVNVMISMSYRAHGTQTKTEPYGSGEATITSTATSSATMNVAGIVDVGPGGAKLSGNGKGQTDATETVDSWYECGSPFGGRSKNHSDTRLTASGSGPIDNAFLSLDRKPNGEIAYKFVFGGALRIAATTDTKTHSDNCGAPYDHTGKLNSEAYSPDGLEGNVNADGTLNQWDAEGTVGQNASSVHFTISRNVFASFVAAPAYLEVSIEIGQCDNSPQPNPNSCDPPHAQLHYKLDSEKIADFGKTTFDGSGSSPAASLVNFEWNPGDGSAVEHTSTPTLKYQYPTTAGRDSLSASLVVTDGKGRISPPATTEVHLCPQDAVSVPMPEVNISFTDLEKFIVRIRYEAFDLAFTPRPAPSNSSCSFVGSGVLPVSVGVGPSVFGGTIPVKSVASATLDFLKEAVVVPDCVWAIPYRGAAVARDCIVGGSGNVLVRWHTDGFSEQLAGREVFNSGPLTYYARVSDQLTYREAVALVEQLLHVELSNHLGWIHWFYTIQEPPASLMVSDRSGNLTGVESYGGEVHQEIPGSAYVSDGNGYSAVILLNPPSSGYHIKVGGSDRTPFNLETAKVWPVAAPLRPFSTSGVLGTDGQVLIDCVDGGVVGTWPDPGSTLSGIALGEYGDANQWPKVFEANRLGVLRPDGTRGMITDPDVVEPGWVLWLPEGRSQHCAAAA